MSTVWDGVAVPRFSKLSENVTADICIVGAGIAGLTIAYTLLREGQSVAVLDSSDIGRGETGLTSAHLSNALDDRFYALEKMHGEDGARLAALSHGEAISRIEQIAGEEDISCVFQRVDGYLFSFNNNREHELERELSAARRAGLLVEWEDRLPWRSFDAGPALRFLNQARFHPLKYLFGLARAVKRRGGKIFTNTRALQFDCGDHLKVSTDQNFSVEAQALVMATHVPINDRVVIHTKQAAYRSYVIGLKSPAGTLPAALFWDTDDPYHYVRSVPIPDDDKHEILVVGGEDHKVGQEEHYDARYKRLEMWARQRFPSAGKIEYQWSGQIIEPADGLAFIGRNPMDHKDIYIVTGDSGNGLTHGTIAGRLIPDLILGQKNPFERLYSPSRKPLGAIQNFVRENLNVVPQYGDWVTPGEIKSEGRIRRGSGKIVRRGLQKIAAFRDQDGNVHECSAVCPHMGCIVRWNTTEESWDCPCHGSRFSPDGKVMNGPANSDLPALKAEEIG